MRAGMRPHRPSNRRRNRASPPRARSRGVTAVDGARPVPQAGGRCPVGVRGRRPLGGTPERVWGMHLGMEGVSVSGTEPQIGVRMLYNGDAALPCGNDLSAQTVETHRVGPAGPPPLAAVLIETALIGEDGEQAGEEPLDAEHVADTEAEHLAVRPLQVGIDTSIHPLRVVNGGRRRAEVAAAEVRVDDATVHPPGSAVIPATLHVHPCHGGTHG